METLEEAANKLSAELDDHFNYIVGTSAGVKDQVIYVYINRKLNKQLTKKIDEQWMGYKVITRRVSWPSVRTK